MGHSFSKTKRVSKNISCLREDDLRKLQDVFQKQFSVNTVCRNTKCYGFTSLCRNNTVKITEGKKYRLINNSNCTYILDLICLEQVFPK